MTTGTDAARDSVDRRAERRMRTLKGARIVFNGGHSVFDCTIRNLSPGGALIEVPSRLGIPTHFDIIMDQGATRRPCSVCWSTEHLMGVRFEEAAEKRA
jgi:hypothetical protein